MKVIVVVGSRLRHLVGIVEELSFTTVCQRLIALELVSRNLGRLQPEGYLEVDGGNIIVRDLGGFEREQEGSRRSVMAVYASGPAGSKY